MGFYHKVRKMAYLMRLYHLHYQYPHNLDMGLLDHHHFHFDLGLYLVLDPGLVHFDLVVDLVPDRFDLGLDPDLGRSDLVVDLDLVDLFDHHLSYQFHYKIGIVSFYTFRY